METNIRKASELKVGDKLVATSSYEWHYGEIESIDKALITVRDLYDKRYRFPIMIDGSFNLTFHKGTSAETRWVSCDEEQYQSAVNVFNERIQRTLNWAKEIPMGIGIMEQLNPNNKMQYVDLSKINLEK